MADYRIRKAKVTDREAWEPLWQAYLVFYHSSVPDGATEVLWQRIHDPDHEFRCLVAEDDESGELIGIAHFFPHGNTWHAAPSCYLNDLFVDPAQRGRGIGEALIDAIVDEGREHGWDELYWLTAADNAIARGLYDKITGGTDGFVTYSMALQN